MADCVRIEWPYKPTDYFEEPFTTSFEDVKIEIFDGRIIAVLDTAKYDRDPSIRERLRNHVEGLFAGVRLQSHKNFDICTGAMHRERPDGKTDIAVFLGPAGLLASSGHLDIKATDSQGNIVKDTRQERIDEKRQFAEMVASKHGIDDVLDAMLGSYANAVEDPDNELIHLFEIWEAIVKKFGSQDQARRALKVSRNGWKSWRTLGQIANDEPLKQGRHRGKHPSQLRDATASELENARSISREMILAYINWLP